MDRPLLAWMVNSPSFSVDLRTDSFNQSGSGKGNLIPFYNYFKKAMIKEI